MRILQSCEQNIILSVTRCLKPSEWFKIGGNSFSKKKLLGQILPSHPTLQHTDAAAKEMLTDTACQEKKGFKNISGCDLTTI